MIILEGPNGAGKTELAKALNLDLGFRIHKFAEVPYTKVMFGEQVIVSKRLSNGRVIQDRTPVISDWVYAGLNTKRSSYIHRDNIVNILSDFNSVLIYVDANVLNPRKNDYDADTIKVIRQRYNAVFDDINDAELPCFYHNHDTMDYFSLLEKMLFLKKAIF